MAKRVLVTGAASGIGLVIARAFTDDGAEVRICDADGAAVAAAQAAGLAAAQVDVADTDALDAWIDGSVAALGGIDVLVNNAGMIRRAPALEVTPADWSEVLRVNLDAVFLLSQAAARVMAGQGGGKIVNLASMLSFQGGVLVPAYTAAKHAVAGLTKALANEWAASGINVNAVAPGYMATDNTAPLRADPVRSAAILDRIPAGRRGTPQDVAGAVVFLAGDLAGYVHGTVLPVDGGWLAR